MDVGNERDAHLLLYRGDRLRGVHVGNGDAHNIRARGLHRLYLVHRRLDIPGLCIAHGLNRDGSIRADRNFSYMNCLYRISFIHHFITILIISLNITKAISASSSTMPAAWI